jgi:hypothetical protein
VRSSVALVLRHRTGLMFHSTSAQSQFLPSARLHFLSCFDLCPLQACAAGNFTQCRSARLRLWPGRCAQCKPSLMCSTACHQFSSRSFPESACCCFFFPSPRSCSPARALSGRVFQLLFGVMSVSRMHRSHFLPHKYLFWHGGCELVSSGVPTRIVTRAQELLFQSLSSQYTISVLFDSPPIVVPVLVRFLAV